MTKNHTSAMPSFPNRRAVFLHLEAAGYQLSKAKLYRDFENGKIQKESDGSVLDIQVRNYIQTFLSDDLSSIQNLKNKKEIEKLDEQIAKLRFEREKEQGKWIPRQEFELEMTARTIIFDNGFRHLFNTKARDWIHLVGGKPDKIAEFLHELNIALDKQLTEYASTKVFQVMITQEEEKDGHINQFLKIES